LGLGPCRGKNVVDFGETEYRFRLHVVCSLVVRHLRIHGASEAPLERAENNVPLFGPAPVPWHARPRSAADEQRPLMLFPASAASTTCYIQIQRAAKRPWAEIQRARADPPVPGCNPVMLFALIRTASYP
jgi:hypothetical protein